MPDLSLNDQKLLLELARKAIRTKLETGDEVHFQTDPPELTQKRGCFVTLRKAGALRGCIGTFESSLRPLFQNVIRMAQASAFQDTRFTPVTKQELPLIQIEISVLGPLEKIDSMEALEIGRHGVYIKLGNRSGTFLPDVAVEQKWGREEFVMYCAREKAGLTPEECSRAEIFRYEVVKFSDGPKV